MKQLKVILIGAGNRGETYTDIMLKNNDKFKVIAVAEPIKSRRENIRKKHNISENMCFDDWKPLFKLGKIADIAIISTMDKQHFEPSMAAIRLKYDILLEKPMSPNPDECIKIAREAEKYKSKILVCHVLRYSAVFMTLKNIIDSGKIGKIMSINHEECVGNIHQSHSFVRGNWGNSDRSSCMLLQKSCHDTDILQWLIGKRCLKVQSFGTLSYFKETNAPEGCADYCVEGCKYNETCPYNAVKLYLEDKENRWFRTTCTRMPNPTDDDVLHAITETQYGKCVYKCDNNVVDHQTLNMMYEDDVFVTFTMNAFNKGGRFIHIMGTHGELRAAIDDDTPLEIYDFKTKTTEKIPMFGKDGINGGHGGGDMGIIETIYEYVTNTYKGKSVTGIMDSCLNHIVVFAAEKSRLTNTVVDLNDFIKDMEG